jgi:gliding motility-associated-like protein
MKLLFTSISLFIIICSNAQFGQFASAIKINNTTINQFYNTTGTGASLINPSGILFQSQNFGIFAYQSAGLKITGTEVKTSKAIFANVCGATLFYTVYSTANPPANPVFTPIIIPFKADCSNGTFNDGLGPCSPGDQKWSIESLNIDLTNLCPDDYTLEIYYAYTGAFEGEQSCDVTQYISNNGANYKASFTISSTLTANASTNTPSICSGQTINLFASASLGKPGYTYAWTGPNGFNSALQNPSINNALINANGLYAVNITDACGTIKNATVNVTVNSLPTTPTATVTVQPTCTVATGTIVITAPTGNNLEYSVNGTTYQSGLTFTGLTPGNYNVTVRNTSTGCISTAIVLVVNNPPAVPTAPTATVTVQPTCTVPTGTIVITAPLGNNLEYSVNGTTYQSGLTFTGLTPGNYNVTVRNTSTGCISTAIVLVVNNPPAVPAAPAASVTVQPTCTVATGTIVITAPTGNNLEYSVNGTTYQSGLTFTGLTPGNYNVTVRNTLTGCTSTATVLTVNAVPLPPAAPTASVTVQPTCTVPTGTIVITTPTGNNLEYSVNGTTYQSGLTFTGLTPGNYNVTVRNTLTGCTSAATILTVNAVPLAPAAPTASVTVQPTCTVSTGTVVITAPTGNNLEYSVNGITYQSGLTFMGLTPGNYNVTVRNTLTGCTSTAIVLVINAVPLPPAAPTASVTVQPTCAVPTGTIVITAPTGNNLEYSVNGTTYQSGLTFTGLTPGNYNVRVRNTTNGCVSNTTSLTINPIPVPPQAPTVISPVLYCLNASATPLTANGSNLLWYTNATGGTGTFVAPTPSTSVVGNTSFYVSQSSPGCESTRSTIVVTVRPIPTVNAGPDKQIISGDAVTLDGSATGFASFNWTPAIANAGLTPTVTPATTTVYTLTATTVDGCTASDAATITVIPYCVKVRNAFTPNGDGINDIWFVTDGLNCTDRISANVYNRYGGLVFSDENYRNGWDGTYKGKRVADGTYYYVLEITLFTGKKVFMKGNVTLLR